MLCVREGEGVGERGRERERERVGEGERERSTCQLSAVSVYLSAFTAGVNIFHLTGTTG